MTILRNLFCPAWALAAGLSIILMIAIYTYNKEVNRVMAKKAAWLVCASMGRPGVYEDCKKQYMDAYNLDMLLLSPEETVDQYTKNARCQDMDSNSYWDETKNKCVILGD